MPPTTDLAEFDDAMRGNLATIVENLPAPVRDFVSSDKPDQIVLELSQKYQMHADQAGKFHQSLLFMLLGVYDPGKFVDRLLSAGLPESAITGILEDLNRLVFTPLRQSEAAPVAPARPPVVPVPAPLAPPVLATSSPLPTAPQIPDPFAALTRPSDTSSAPVSPVAPPTMRTMAHDIEGMKTGVAPASYTMSAPPAAPAPVPKAPEQAPLPPSWAAPVAPPSDAPSFTRVPGSSPASRNAPPDLHEVTSTLQKYGIDPYREPME